jgi:hypothetical protein
VHAGNADFGRVLEIAAQLNGVKGEERRIGTIARLAGVQPAELARLVAERPCSFDSNGAWANRVRVAARRRRIMALAAKVYYGAASECVSWLSETASDLVAEVTAIEAEHWPT